MVGRPVSGKWTERDWEEVVDQGRDGGGLDQDGGSADGENWLDFGQILTAEPIRYPSTLEVSCERKPGQG